MALSDHKISFTFEQFMELSESIRVNTGYKTEYGNGEILYFSPNMRHGKIIRNLCNILELALPKSCLVVNEMHIKFKEKEFRVPDIAVYCGEDIKEKIEADTLYLDMPKLIFEVLSDSTEDSDRNYKMNLYAEKSIEEYFIVDYKENVIEQYFLNDNEYKLNKKYNSDDTCTLLLYPEVSFLVSNAFKLFK